MVGQVALAFGRVTEAPIVSQIQRESQSKYVCVLVCALDGKTVWLLVGQDIYLPTACSRDRFCCMPRRNCKRKRENSLRALRKHTMQFPIRANRLTERRWKFGAFFLLGSEFNKVEIFCEQQTVFERQ